MPDMPTACSTRDELMLEGFFDYAGLYPPASLDLKSVIEHWNRYIETEDDWMLARLIIPASKICEFKELAKDVMPRHDEEPWQLSVLLPPASDDSFKDAVKTTIAFNEEDLGAIANVVEFKATTTDEIESALNVLHDDLFPFIELPVDDDPRGLIASLSGCVAGAKVRTGGVTPELYPSSKHLARFIYACGVARIPFKATAGLHHPNRNENTTVGVNEFGFLNVLGASIASMRQDATEADVEAQLNLQIVELSEFTEEEIATARSEVFCSIGSCSFEEPVEDLRSMGILKEPK